MARFDLYRPRGGSGLLLDVQGACLDHLATRVVAPLLNPGDVPRRITDLHPLLTIEGKPHLLATQLLAAVPKRELGRAVGNLEAHREAITRALDVLTGTY